jgi:hypothetical protein
MKQLIEKLVAIQSELKAPKGQTNKFGGYKYRSCEDILEALKPHLKEQGLFLSITDELVAQGNRYYIKASAIITDGVDRWSVDGWAREEEVKKGMDSSQITGASSSYARKYALNGLFGIDDTKDSDATNDGDIPQMPMVNLQTAIYDIGLANSLDGLKTIWSKYPQFQKQQEFIDAKDKKKNELNNLIGERVNQIIEKNG